MGTKPIKGTKGGATGKNVIKSCRKEYRSSRSNGMYWEDPNWMYYEPKLSWFQKEAKKNARKPNANQIYHGTDTRR